MHGLRSWLGIAIALLLSGHAVWMGTSTFLAPLPRNLERYRVEARERYFTPEDEAALRSVVPGEAKVLLVAGHTRATNTNRVMWTIHALVPAITTFFPEDGFDLVVLDPQGLTPEERRRIEAQADDYHILLELDNGLVVMEPRND